MDNNHIYFGARQTCLEMLRDRKYNVPDYLFNVTQKEYETIPNHHIIREITDQDNHPVFIIIKDVAEDDKDGFFKSIGKIIDPSPLKRDITKKDDIMKYITEQSIHLIIIYNSLHYSGVGSKFIEDNIGHAWVEFFDYRHLFVNPTKHIYQPKWRLMNTKEITELLQRYDANRINLGSICLDDPINRYYGGKLTDIYEITRDGTNIFYRKVAAKRMNLKTEKK